MFTLKLKEARKLANMSQQDVASKLGITQPTLSGWEADPTTVGAEALYKLCVMYSVTPNQMMGIDEETEMVQKIEPGILYDELGVELSILIRCYRKANTRDKKLVWGILEDYISGTDADRPISSIFTEKNDVKVG